MIKLLSIILATSFLSSLKLTSAIFLGKENGNATKPNAIAQVEKNHRVKISMQKNLGNLRSQMKEGSKLATHITQKFQEIKKASELRDQALERANKFKLAALKTTDGSQEALKLAASNDLREAEKFRAFAKSGVEDVVRSIVQMQDNYIETFKFLNTTLIADQEFEVDFDPTSRDDLIWVEGSMSMILNGLPELKLLERKLQLIPSVNKALNQVIKSLQIVTSVIGQFPLDDKAEDYVVKGVIPPKLQSKSQTNSTQSLVRQNNENHKKLVIQIQENFGKQNQERLQNNSKQNKLMTEKKNFTSQQISKK